MLTRRSLLIASLAALISPAVVHADPPAPPAYHILLRSRHAEVTPYRIKDAQTGGGSIVVEQPEPNTIVVTMGGSAVAGSTFHGSAASIDFNLVQDLEIIPTRKGVRPPRVGMVGRVVGTLQVTDPGKCCTVCGISKVCGTSKACGTAEQGPATACLSLGDKSLLCINVQPSSVACGQESSINHKDGSVEAGAAAGFYHLTGSFRIGVTQGKGVWNRQAAVADFDPAPQLDSSWSDALKPFRAVPRKNFGFQFVVRVVEEPPAANGPKK
jgi:hypothetical protein